MGIVLPEDTKILVVEDDPDQRKLLASYLAPAFKCQVLEANDGLDGLRIMLAEQQIPQLIILDLMMPHLSGIEFLSIVRGRPDFDGIPVLVCTHVAETSELKGKISHQIHSYLVKPISEEKLIEKAMDALHPIRLRVDYSA